MCRRPIVVIVAFLLTGKSVALDQDRILPESLVCESAESYNETIIINLKNQIAELKGKSTVPYPSDCRVIGGKALSGKFLEYSGGSAVIEVAGETLHTAKENLVLGSEAAARLEGRDQCIKKVLNRFCLGGNVSELAKPDKVDGDAYVYMDGERKILIREFNEKVATVSIFYPEPSWLSYRLLLERLLDKYGSGVNLDTFPEYADNDSSKATAITLGKGRAMTVWNQTGWSLKYGWASDKWRVLTYMHDKLAQKLQAKERERL